MNLSNNCKDCKYYRDTMIFELCTHPRAEYVIADKHDFHSIGHMRKFDCGPGGMLFEKK